MATLSENGHAKVSDIASRHGFCTEAVQELLEAVARGNSSMAQFSHPEFGGAGQWMRGGMIMVSDMLNHRLKDRVGALASELAIVSSSPDFHECFAEEPESQRGWWPAELGAPNSSGRQNEFAYAYFAETRRLAVNDGIRIRIYDTLGQQITGVAQQQSGAGTVSFSTALGLVDLSTLPVLSD